MTRIRFSEFEADLRTEELRRSGRTLRLPNQSFVVLAMLLRNPGQLVTREELRKRLWPRDTFIEYDQALNAAVNRLREALGDSADNPRYVQTLPRRGYRFIGTVELERQASPAAASSESPTAEASPTPMKPRTPAHRRPWVSVLLIAFVATAVAFLRFTPREDRSDLKLVPFTSLPNQEIAPSFSPDGHQIAFAWNGDADNTAGFDVYVKGTDTEKTLRLTNRPAQWLRLAWSHDGRQIAFARATSTDGGIFLIPALGGDERRLATAWFEQDAPTQIAWSADDSELVYSAYGPSGIQLYRLRLDSLQSQPLRPALSSCQQTTSPAFSPDGTQIAFICTASVAVYSIHTMQTDGSNPRKLTDVQGYPEGIAWSADGSRVIFANDSGDGGSLWQVSLDGKVSRVAFGEEASAPATAAKRNRMAYVRGRKVIDIWRIDLQAAAPEQSATRLIASTRIQMIPQYSPDGTRIAFQSNRTGSSEIWVADADGANPVRISSFKGPQTGAPTWCADGRRLAFDSRASGISALYVVDVDERLPRMVKTNVTNLGLPVWSGDCRWLVASDGRANLFLVPSSGGTAKRFTQRPSYYASVSGNRVVFNMTGDKDVTLWQKFIDGSDERALEGLPSLSYTDSWVAGESGVYFTLAADDARMVRFYDFQTHRVSPVVRLNRPATPLGGLGMSISRDNRYLLYTQTEDQQSDIMLVEPK